MSHVLKVQRDVQSVVKNGHLVENASMQGLNQNQFGKDGQQSHGTCHPSGPTKKNVSRDNVKSELGTMFVLSSLDVQ